MIDSKKYVRVVTNKDLPKVGDSVVINNQNVTFTENGNYEAEYPYTGFGRVEVDVPIPAGSIYKPVVDGEVTQGDSIDLTGINVIGRYAYYYGFHHAVIAQQHIDMSNIEEIKYYGCAYMFQYSQNLISVDLSGLKKIGQGGCDNMFDSCSDLISADISNLEEIDGSYACALMFYQTKITSIDVGKIRSVNGYDGCYAMFSYTKLVSVNFSSLSVLTGQNAFERAFSNVTTLTTVSFPALKSDSFGTYTNQFKDMLKNDTGVTVHFPSNLQSVIGSWSDVQDGFSGTNTTVLFDLPATE